MHLTRACRPPSFFFFFALVATALATAGVTRLPLFRDFGTAELVLGGPLLFIRVVPPTSPLPCPWYCLALATHRLQLTVASSRSLPPFCHRLCGCAYGTLFRVVANALARARLCRPPPSTTLCPCTFAAAALPTTFPLPPPSPPSRRRGSYLFRMYLVSRHSMLWLKEWFDSTGPGAGTSKLSSCRGPPRAYSSCFGGSMLPPSRSPPLPVPPPRLLSLPPPSPPLAPPPRAPIQCFTVPYESSASHIHVGDSP